MNINMKITVSRLRRQLFLSVFPALLCLAAPAWADSAATLTLADGKVALLRGTATYTVTPGIKLESGDMLETGAKSQAQVEFADGLILGLAADSRLYLLPAGAGSSDFALAGGWMKAAVPAGRKGEARTLRYILPGLIVETSDATLVLHAGGEVDELFNESGAAKATEVAHDGTPGKSLAAKSSDYVSRKTEQPAALGRPPATFLGGMPKNFMDSLPALAAKLKPGQREPARDHDTAYAEARDWLNGNAMVRAGLVARYQPRIKDAEFKNGLVADVALHPEWEKSLGGGKPAAKKK